MGQKNQGDNVLCKNWHVLGEKEFQATPTETETSSSSKESCDCLPGIFSKFPTSSLVLFAPCIRVSIPGYKQVTRTMLS